MNRTRTCFYIRKSEKKTSQYHDIVLQKSCFINILQIHILIYIFYSIQYALNSVLVSSIVALTSILLKICSKRQSVKSIVEFEIRKVKFHSNSILDMLKHYRRRERSSNNNFIIITDYFSYQD